LKRIFIIIIFIIIASGSASAITVDKLKELIVINNSGSADVDAELTISKLTDTVFFYPVRFSNPTDFEIEPKEKFDFTVVNENGISMLRIKYNGNIDDSVFVIISFYVSHVFNIYEHPVIDFSSKQFVNKFQNVTFDKIKNLISGIVLPEGYVISKVNDFNSGGQNGYYNISNNGIRESIELNSSNIDRAGGPSVDFTFRATSKTKLTFAIALVSLIVFIWILRLRKRVYRKK